MLRYRLFILDFSVLIGLFLLAGSIHLFYPTEMRWNLVNYHYYNAWAFIYNRLGYDIAPAMINT